jgi:hypothetical protein
VTLFDSFPTPAPVPTSPAAPPPPPPLTTTTSTELACRLTGCTRPLEAHTVTQAAIENALRPVPITPRKPRKKRKK